MLKTSILAERQQTFELRLECDRGNVDSFNRFPLDKNLYSCLGGLVRCFRWGVNLCEFITFLSSHA